MAAATVEVERHLPYAPRHLCALVADIRAYPDFIPWMRTLTILSDKTDGAFREIVARAEVGWRAISERFTSRVRIGENSVDVALVDGPFRTLENAWRFRDDGKGGAIVDFRVTYEFKNPLLQALASVNRALVADRIMKAFEDEARRRFA